MIPPVNSFLRGLVLAAASAFFLLTMLCIAPLFANDGGRADVRFRFETALGVLAVLLMLAYIMGRGAVVEWATLIRCLRSRTPSVPGEGRDRADRSRQPPPQAPSDPVV